MSPKPCQGESVCECGKRIELRVDTAGLGCVSHESPACDAFMQQEPGAFALLHKWTCVDCGSEMTFHPFSGGNSA